MAPSPTGDIHIGTLRTGLYAYAFAKKNDAEYPEKKEKISSLN